MCIQYHEKMGKREHLLMEYYIIVKKTFPVLDELKGLELYIGLIKILHEQL